MYKITMKYRMDLKNTYYLIRHGECLSNLTRTNDSHGDVSNVLTELGKEQMKNCAKSLGDTEIIFEKIISSPFVRAVESAEILLRNIQIHDTDILPTDLLKEMDHGSETQGKPIVAFDNEILPDDLHKPHGDGESYWDVRGRMFELISQLESEWEDKHLILVTHGTPIWMFYSVVHDLDEKQTLAFRDERKATNGFFIKNADPLVIL